MASQKPLLNIIETERHDTDVSIAALSLQARAWRILALIALADQERGRKYAQWLFFKTIPFVDGPAIEKFLAENEGLAATCGTDAGVFTARPRADR